MRRQRVQGRSHFAAHYKLTHESVFAFKGAALSFRPAAGNRLLNGLPYPPKNFINCFAAYSIRHKFEWVMQFI